MLFYLRDYTFKMCTGAPKWSNTCKLYHFKMCCRFCSRIINRAIFFIRKRCHHFTKHIGINGPPTAHYTSMHLQYYSLWNCQWYNQATVIMCNEYAIFLDSWPKTLKNFLIAWKAGQENITESFTKHHSKKHHKRVRPVYIQTDKMPRPVPLVLLKGIMVGDDYNRFQHWTLKVIHITIWFPL